MVKMKNQLIAQAVAPAAKVVTAGRGRKPRMDEMGTSIRPKREQLCSRTAGTIHVASSACSRSFNDLRRERAEMKPRVLPD